MKDELKLYNQILRMGDYNSISFGIFLDTIKSSNGVYVFSKSDNLNVISDILYIGKSLTNLKTRSLESFYKRFFRKYSNIYIHYITELNKIDTDLLEMYMINECEPKYNYEFKYKSASCFDIDFSDIKSDCFLLKCNNDRIIKDKDKSEPYQLLNKKSSGIYIFTDNECLDNSSKFYYIGMSVRNITSRISRAKIMLNENNVKDYHLHKLSYNNALDISINEVLLINKHSPIYNKKSMYNEKSNLIL